MQNTTLGFPCSFVQLYQAHDENAGSSFPVGAFDQWNQKKYFSGEDFHFVLSSRYLYVVWALYVHWISILSMSWMYIRFVEKGTPDIKHLNSEHEQICLAGVVTGCSWVIACLRWMCCLTERDKWLNNNICVRDLAYWKITQNSLLLKVDWPCLTLTALLPKQFPQAPCTVHRIRARLIWNF